jgi:hypothetical protein
MIETEMRIKEEGCDLRLLFREGRVQAWTFFPSGIVQTYWTGTIHEFVRILSKVQSARQPRQNT